jgi:plasmid stability protein
MPSLRGKGLTGTQKYTYCETMKNITVSVDDGVYRRARVKAAERETSISALVRDFLVKLAEDESSSERLAREERELRERIHAFRASDRLSRHELHDRGR